MYIRGFYSIMNLYVFYTFRSAHSQLQNFCSSIWMLDCLTLLKELPSFLLKSKPLENFPIRIGIEHQLITFLYLYLNEFYTNRIVTLQIIHNTAYRPYIWV